MFKHYTVLEMRSAEEGPTALPPVYGYWRDLHFAQGVMGVKRHLRRCVETINQGLCEVPDYILVDNGSLNGDLKTELEGWMKEQPKLQHIRVVFPRQNWLSRCWGGVLGSVQAA